MIDWLLNNKEWIFSGGGVAVIVGFFALIRRLRTKQHSGMGAVVVRIEQTAGRDQPDVPSTVAVKVERVSPITPTEIRTAINAAPPLQRDTVAERYEGQRIEWDTKLHSADREQDGAVKLFLDANPFTVVCNVNLADYRELAVLPAGANIRVNGIIETATSHWVSLTDARLTFLSATNT